MYEVFRSHVEKETEEEAIFIEQVNEHTFVYAHEADRLRYEYLTEWSELLHKQDARIQFASRQEETENGCVSVWYCLYVKGEQGYYKQLFKVEEKEMVLSDVQCLVFRITDEEDYKYLSYLPKDEEESLFHTIHLLKKYVYDLPRYRMPYVTGIVSFQMPTREGESA